MALHLVWATKPLVHVAAAQATQAWYFAPCWNLPDAQSTQPAAPTCWETLPLAHCTHVWDPFFDLSKLPLWNLPAGQLVQ